MMESSIAENTRCGEPRASAPRPQLALPIRLSNRALSAWERLSRRAMFPWSPESLIAVAARRANWSRSAPDDLVRTLTEICEVSTQPPFMTPLGRLSMRAELLRRARARLELEQVTSLHPRVSGQVIKEPWFVLGLPRSGTTLLHRLLARDPAHRAPLTWETNHPFEALQSAQQRARSIAEVDRGLRFFNSIAPQAKAIHELGAELPEECMGFLANAFDAQCFSIGRLGRYWAWGWLRHMKPHAGGASASQRRTYLLHQSQLQLLQLSEPQPRRWLLKCPLHFVALEALAEVYPDAGFIHIHRDPVEVVGSACSMAWHGLGANYERVAGPEVGQAVLEQMLHMADAGRRARQRLHDGGSVHRFVDLDYREFIADPIASVSRIYKALGSRLSDAARARMGEYLRENPQNKFGRHQYRVDDFGLTADQIRAQLPNG